MQDVDGQPGQAAASSDPELTSNQKSGPATDSASAPDAVAQTGAAVDTEPATETGTTPQNPAPAIQTEATPDPDRATKAGSTPQGPVPSSTQTPDHGSGSAQGPDDDSAKAAGVSGNGHPLLSGDARQDFGGRWNEIQANFVDHPQGSVQDADVLVLEVMQRVTGSLSKERERLESQWRQGDDVSTEDLRVALTRYRSFFDRLLSA